MARLLRARLAITVINFSFIFQSLSCMKFGIYMVTGVVRLLGVSKEDPGCRHILFQSILKNKNLFSNFRLKRLLYIEGFPGKFLT